MVDAPTSLSVGNFGLEGILKREKKGGNDLAGAPGKFWGSVR